MDDNTFKCNRMSVKEIRIITDSLRNKFCEKNVIPVDTEKIIEKHYHIDIIPQSGIKSATKTDAFLRSDLSGIIVDLKEYMAEEEWSTNRIRFSFAHELGHYVLHRRIYSFAEYRTLEEYCQFIENFPDQEYTAFEWQANEFAEVCSSLYPG